MTDGTTFRGRETETQALGKTWRVSRCDLNVWDAYLDWARGQLPDPNLVAEGSVLRLMRNARQIRERMKLKPTEKDYLDEVEGTFLLEANMIQQERQSRLAMDKACSHLALDSQEFQSLVRTPRGAAQLMYLLLKQHQPDIDIETALAIITEIGPEEQARIISVTQGKSRPGRLGNESAPAASS